MTAKSAMSTQVSQSHRLKGSIWRVHLCKVLRWLFMRKKKFRKEFLLMLSVAFTCMTVANAQEDLIMSLYKDLQDPEPQIWYGNDASDVWDHFLNTYNENEKGISKRKRFYGSDIYIDVLIVKEINDSSKKNASSSNGNSDTNLWNATVSNTGITKTITNKQIADLVEKTNDKINTSVTINKLVDTLRKVNNKIEFKNESNEVSKRTFTSNQIAIALEKANPEINTTITIEQIANKLQEMDKKFRLPNLSNGTELTPHKIAKVLKGKILEGNAEKIESTEIARILREAKELGVKVDVLSSLNLGVKLRECYTPHPRIFWERVLIRPTGEIVICEWESNGI